MCVLFTGAKMTELQICNRNFRNICNLRTQNRRDVDTCSGIKERICKMPLEMPPVSQDYTKSIG